MTKKKIKQTINSYEWAIKHLDISSRTKLDYLEQIDRLKEELNDKQNKQKKMK